MRASADPVTKTAYQDANNASTSANAANSSAASSHVANYADRSWIAFAVLLVVALVVIVREESRATRAEDRAQEATQRLNKAQADGLQEQSQALRDYATELQLRRYNLDWFRTHEHAELEVRVGVLERYLQEVDHGRRRHNHSSG